MHQSAKADNFQKCEAPGTSLPLQGHSERDKTKWISQGEAQSEHGACLDLLDSLAWYGYILLRFFLCGRCEPHHQEISPMQRGANATFDLTFTRLLLFTAELHSFQVQTLEIPK